MNHNIKRMIWDIIAYEFLHIRKLCLSVIWCVTLWSGARSVNPLITRCFNWHCWNYIAAQNHEGLYWKHSRLNRKKMSIEQHQNGAKTGTNMVAYSQWSYKGPVLRLYDSSTWTSWWTKGRVAYILRRNCAHVTSLYLYLPYDLPFYLQHANTSSCIVIRAVHKWFSAMPMSR